MWAISSGSWLWKRCGPKSYDQQLPAVDPRTKEEAIPPACGSRSSTVTSTPALASSYAQARPATPPPSTTTRPFIRPRMVSARAARRCPPPHPRQATRAAGQRQRRQHHDEGVRWSSVAARADEQRIAQEQHDWTGPKRPGGRSPPPRREAAEREQRNPPECIHAERGEPLRVRRRTPPRSAPFRCPSNPAAAACSSTRSLGPTRDDCRCSAAPARQAVADLCLVQTPSLDQDLRFREHGGQPEGREVSSPLGVAVVRAGQRVAAVGRDRTNSWKSRRLRTVHGRA